MLGSNNFYGTRFRFSFVFLLDLFLFLIGFTLAALWVTKYFSLQFSSCFLPTEEYEVDENKYFRKKLGKLK